VAFEDVTELPSEMGRAEPGLGVSLPFTNTGWKFHFGKQRGAFALRLRRFMTANFEFRNRRRFGFF